MVGELITVPNLPLYLVDVRDVANAHILAMQKEAANGQRYLCVADRDFWVSQVAQRLKKWYPEYPIVTKPLPNWCFTLIPTVLARMNEPILYP
jgi:nucleoside-diphosphate-sugar epimerase